MLELLDRLKKEWHAIHAAPWSFSIVCLAAIVFCWSGFHYVYRGKLADSDRRANQWKSDAEYWKDLAEHPKKTETAAPEGAGQQPTKPERPHQARQQKPSIILPPGTAISATTSAPDSAAVGINTGTVTVNPPANPLAPVVYYDFGGGKHTVTGNRFVAEVGEQTVRFKEMSSLEKLGKWEELRQEAETQIKVVPMWLTPYLFAAEAYANLGDKSRAVELCQFVKKKSGGNQDFDRPADAMLAGLR